MLRRLIISFLILAAVGAKLLKVIQTAEHELTGKSLDRLATKVPVSVDATITSPSDITGVIFAK